MGKLLNKKLIFPALIFIIILINSLVFLPKYGSWGEATDVEYKIIAENMFNGHGFSLNGQKTMFREPAYPFFLFTIYKIFGVNFNAIRIIQFILLFAVIYFSYKLSLKLFGALSARITVLAISILPIFGLYATDLISEIFASFLVIIFMLFFIKSIEERENGSYFSAIAGLFLGVLILTKSVFTLLPIFIIPIYFLMKSRKSAKKAFFFGIVLLAIVSPWAYRNHLNFDKFAIADRGGMLLYLHAVKSGPDYKQLANYSVAATTGEYFVRLRDPSFNMIKGEGIDLMNKKIRELLDKGYNFPDADKIMAREAKKLFFEKPIKNIFIGFLEVIKLNAPLMPTKRSVMFSFSNQINNTPIKKFLIGAAIIIIRIIWLTVVFLTMYGSYMAIKRKNNLTIPIIVFIAYLNGVIFFLQGEPRTVFPLYSLYYILFSFGLLSLIEKFVKRKNI
mgnify:CR=1 FL=1